MEADGVLTKRLADAFAAALLKHFRRLGAREYNALQQCALSSKLEDGSFCTSFADCESRWCNVDICASYCSAAGA